MAESALVETEVKGEERRMTQTVQEWDDFLVLHPLSSNVMANVRNRNMPTPEQFALFRGDVFIEDVHVPVGSRRYSSACSRKA